jgi:hypothetical protein
MDEVRIKSLIKHYLRMYMTVELDYKQADNRISVSVKIGGEEITSDSIWLDL